MDKPEHSRTPWKIDADFSPCSILDCEGSVVAETDMDPNDYEAGEYAAAKIVHAVNTLPRLEADNAAKVAENERLRETLRMVAGVLQVVNRDDLRGISKVITFNGEWADLGTVTVNGVLDSANAALSATTPPEEKKQ